MITLEQSYFMEKIKSKLDKYPSASLSQTVLLSLIHMTFDEIERENKPSNDPIDIIINNIQSKYPKYTITEMGRHNISKWVGKYNINDIIDAINVSYNKYAKFEKGEFTNESFEFFFGKIPGILYNKTLSEPQQKLSLLKNITKNRLHYFDDKVAKIILNEYVNLFQKNHTEDEILIELTSGNLYILCNDARNWTIWRQTIEQWIEELKPNS